MDSFLTGLYFRFSYQGRRVRRVTIICSSERTLRAKGKMKAQLSKTNPVRPRPKILNFPVQSLFTPIRPPPCLLDSISAQTVCVPSLEEDHFLSICTNPSPPPPPSPRHPPTYPNTTLPQADNTHRRNHPRTVPRSCVNPSFTANIPRSCARRP